MTASPSPFASAALVHSPCCHSGSAELNLIIQAALPTDTGGATNMASAFCAKPRLAPRNNTTLAVKAGSLEARVEDAPELRDP